MLRARPLKTTDINQFHIHQDIEENKFKIFNKGLRMRTISLLFLAGLVGCSSSPTNYGPRKSNQGYSDQTVTNDLRMAEFQGNAQTKKETAELFAKFRAIEVCKEMNKEAHIMVVNDKSYEKNVVQANTAGPDFYYGMSPYYGRYGAYSPGLTMGYSSYNTSYTSETYTYPHFETYFECTDKAFDAGMHFQNLSASQMASLMKDVQGAVQVNDVADYSPNKGIFQKGDIITHVAGERVAKQIDVYKASRKSPGAPIRVDFFRDGKKKSASAQFKDVSDMMKEANAEIVKAACQNKDLGSKNELCKK